LTCATHIEWFTTEHDPQRALDGLLYDIEVKLDCMQRQLQINDDHQLNNLSRTILCLTNNCYAQNSHLEVPEASRYDPLFMQSGVSPIIDYSANSSMNSRNNSAGGSVQNIDKIPEQDWAFLIDSAFHSDEGVGSAGVDHHDSNLDSLTAGILDPQQPSVEAGSTVDDDPFDGFSWLNNLVADNIIPMTGSAASPVIHHLTSNTTNGINNGGEAGQCTAIDGPEYEEMRRLIGEMARDIPFQRR
jgi:hypothetical protein